MGLLDSYRQFKTSRLEKRIEKSGKLVKNPKAIKEDRWAALQFLATDAQGAEQVVPFLLQRFEYSLEHGILDSREKDLALKGVVRFGKESISILKDWIKATDRIAWPIKCLKEVADEQETISALKAALFFEDVRFDQAKVDKNYDVLCYLRDYRLEGYESSLSHFLSDVDERVRFAAAETLAEQSTQEAAVYLEPLLSDDTVENRRIKEIIAHAFARNKWVLQNPQELSLRTSAFSVNKQGILEAN